MKKLFPLIFLLTSCQNNTNDGQKTIETLYKTIDRLLQKKQSHFTFYLGVKDSTLDKLLNASIDVKTIIETSSNDNNSSVLVQDLFRSKYSDLIPFDDWTKNIDSTLTGSNLKIDILANELSFLIEMLDLLERSDEYSFKEIGFLTKTEKNVTQVYITTVMRFPFAEFLFPLTMSDSLQSGYKGITDTMRIVGRQSGDHYTIVNKDGMNYQYVLKFAKADGTFEYFPVK